MSTKLTKLIIHVVEACVSRDANSSTNAPLKTRLEYNFEAHSRGWLYRTTTILLLSTLDRKEHGSARTFQEPLPTPPPSLQLE